MEERRKREETTRDEGNRERQIKSEEVRLG